MFSLIKIKMKALTLALLCAFVIAIVALVVFVVMLMKRNNRVEKYENPKLILYMLTFNNPRQVRHTANTWRESSQDWFSIPFRKIIVDNSTEEHLKAENQNVAKEMGFEYLHTGKNLGITGGRSFVAKHFEESDGDYYIFFEDDMGLYPATETGLCKNGYQKFVPDLLPRALKITIEENLDFLKLSFAEFYASNDAQYSYSVCPQGEKDKLWPGKEHDDKFTNFRKIKNVDGLSYALGEVFYCNWPLIISKDGNKKIFVQNDLETPSEGDLTLYTHKLIVNGKVKSAVLLASPVWHNRVYDYEKGTRVENQE